MLSNSNISVKEYYKISKYKNLKIEIEKIWHLKTTTMPVIVGALGMIKKGQINTLIRYLTVPAYMKYKKLHFAELLISLGDYYQCDLKSNTWKYEWNIEHIITILLVNDCKKLELKPKMK